MHLMVTSSFLCVGKWRLEYAETRKWRTQPPSHRQGSTGAEFNNAEETDVFAPSPVPLPPRAPAANAVGIQLCVCYRCPAP
eukprot:m.347643 g.347643  ORF g.347643 m.347643 type:complete len:81 (+) comp20672_c0_seq5:4950-5192(+)